MATKMEMAQLELVEEGTVHSQKVAVLNKPYDISIQYARIDEPGEEVIHVLVDCEK